MKEFELLANEEQIRDMAREFAMVKVRQEIIKAGKNSEKETMVNNTTNNVETNNVERSTESSINQKSSLLKSTSGKEPTSQSVQKSPLREQPRSCSKAEGEQCSCERERSSCQSNIEAIAKMAQCYYIERDIEQAIRRLYAIAPPVCKDEIAQLIKLKCENTEYLLVNYTQLANNSIQYSPSLFNGRNFCPTLGKIAILQERLLLCLCDIRECTQMQWLINRETLISTCINKMSIMCIFNNIR